MVSVIRYTYLPHPLTKLSYKHLGVLDSGAAHVLLHQKDVLPEFGRQLAQGIDAAFGRPSRIKDT
jgi:hypothetical protein